MARATPRHATSRGSVYFDRFPLGLGRASHDYFENIVTFSLQLGIRRVNSRFVAYKPNFHNPLEGQPDCGYIHLHEHSSVLHNHVSSLNQF